MINDNMLGAFAFIVIVGGIVFVMALAILESSGILSAIAERIRMGGKK